MTYRVTLFILRILLKLFLRIEVQGQGNIPIRGAFILCSNHISYLDPPILAVGCFKRRLNFLAKEELFCNRFFGWYIRKLGAFPIKRNYSDIGAMKESIRRIRKGQPLVVFPEGGRSSDGKIGEGLPGVALLAIKTKTPIVPAFIKSTDNTLSLDSKTFKFCKTYLKFGKPLNFYENNTQDYSEVTNRIIFSIKELSNS